jgi:hypothetical protein
MHMNSSLVAMVAWPMRNEPMGGCYIPNEPIDMDYIHKGDSTKTHGSKASSITIKNDAVFSRLVARTFFLQAWTMSYRNVNRISCQF